MAASPANTSVIAKASTPKRPFDRSSVPRSASITIGAVESGDKTEKGLIRPRGDRVATNWPGT